MWTTISVSQTRLEDWHPVLAFEWIHDLTLTCLNLLILSVLSVRSLDADVAWVHIWVWLMLLKFWVRIFCWSWKESSSNIQIWPCEICWPCFWPQTFWYTLLLLIELREHGCWHLPWQAWTWSKLVFLKWLSFRRCWPRTAAWTNFVSTSDGLWWGPTFSSEMTPSLRISWIHRCLSSICFDYLEMPRRKAIVCLLMNRFWQWSWHL